MFLHTKSSKDVQIVSSASVLCYTLFSQSPFRETPGTYPVAIDVLGVQAFSPPGKVEEPIPRSRSVNKNTFSHDRINTADYRSSGRFGLHVGLREQTTLACVLWQLWWSHSCVSQLTLGQLFVRADCQRVVWHLLVQVIALNLRCFVRILPPSLSPTRHTLATRGARTHGTSVSRACASHTWGYVYGSLRDLFIRIVLKKDLRSVTARVSIRSNPYLHSYLYIFIIATVSSLIYIFSRECLIRRNPWIYKAWSLQILPQSSRK